MKKTKSVFLSLSVILAASVFSFSQQPVPSSAVLNKIAGQAAVSLSLPAEYKFPGEISVEAPRAVRVNAGSAEKALAPKPGKDLLPVVQDQARVKAVLKLISDIYAGNNLPYSQDGVVFKNKEGRLPVQPLGFYREYTLLTGSAPHTVTIGETTYQVAPDLSARGSERLIIGGGEKVYYTPDHYANFILLTMVY